MNRATIIRLGIEAGLTGEGVADIKMVALERFAALVEAEIIQNVKVSIPTLTMEQEFQSHYRRGYAAAKAEALKAHQQAIEAAVLAEREALARRADSIGHHWSGAPATAFFEFAEEIRSRTQNMRIPDTHK